MRRYRRLGILCAGAALAGALACAGGEKPVGEGDVARARAALAPFKQQLFRALTEAMADGPVSAIEVCNTRAPAIADSLASGGLRMGRTSHRLRNPANAPAEWVMPLLERYAADPSLTEGEALRVDARTIGYVEPIRMQPMCLVCHGAEITPEIAQHLDALYPDDRARGFAEGDFRGLFWVTLLAQEEDR